jgi:hypothetical protein
MMSIDTCEESEERRIRLQTTNPIPNVACGGDGQDNLFFLFVFCDYVVINRSRGGEGSFLLFPSSEDSVPEGKTV